MSKTGACIPAVQVAHQAQAGAVASHGHAGPSTHRVPPSSDELFSKEAQEETRAAGRVVPWQGPGAP